MVVAAGGLAVLGRGSLPIGFGVPVAAPLIIPSLIGEGRLGAGVIRSSVPDCMKTAEFCQSTADAMGVLLYLYPDGSVTNFRKVGAEPAATIEPHESWRPPGDHGLGDQSSQSPQ